VTPPDLAADLERRLHALGCCVVAVLDQPSNPAAWAELALRAARASGTSLAELQGAVERMRLALAAGEEAAAERERLRAELAVLERRAGEGGGGPGAGHGCLA
jgi:hypothetical protein